MTKDEVKKLIEEAAKAYNYVLEDTHITSYKVENGQVLFYEKDKYAFSTPLKDIISGDY